MELSERVVLVTGGGRRIGRAIALRLAASGMRVAVHYRSSSEAACETAEDCRRLGGDAATFPADLGEPSACTELISAVLAHFGRLDVLVNNAAVFERMTLDEFDLARWDHTLRVNLTAPLLLVYAAREALRAARGRVVNLGDAATRTPWPSYLAYQVAKGGLDVLTCALARALAPEVNVVGVAPGVAEWPKDFDETTRSRLAARIPLGRAGEAADIAATVHFLLRHGDYITGVVVPVDGGRSLA